jgi:PTS system galactitol-specific IIB component
VCGAGVVVSSIISRKIKDSLAPSAVDVSVINLLPMAVKNFAVGNEVDFIVTTNAIPGEMRVPIINAIPFLTGLKEEDLINEIQRTARKVLEEE